MNAEDYNNERIRAKNEVANALKAMIEHIDKTDPESVGIFLGAWHTLITRRIF